MMMGARTAMDMSAASFSGLRFTALEQNVSISMEMTGSLSFTPTLETSRNGMRWTAFVPGSDTIVLADVGDVVYFRAGTYGNSRFGMSSSGYAGWRFVIDNMCEASGDIMSIVGDATWESYCFRGLFKDCASLATAPELPRTSLVSHCYDSMFEGCTSLTAAPALPADELAEGCYAYMFNGCTSLEVPPELSAETLAESCYEGMFMESGLTFAPRLGAMETEALCYAAMFKNCASMESDIGGSSPVSAPESLEVLPAITLADQCYAEMFSGCTAMESAPVIAAVRFGIGSCSEMFSGCSSLSIIKTGFSVWPDVALADWVDGVAATGTFICCDGLGKPGSISTGASKCPEGWTVQNIDEQGLYFVAETDEASLSMSYEGWTADDMPALETSVNCGISWEAFVPGTTEIELRDIGDRVYFRAAESSTVISDSALRYLKFSFAGSSRFAAYGSVMSLLGSDVGSDIPVPQFCFANLFYGCTGLTRAPTLPSMTLTKGIYSCMFYGCTGLVEAPDLPATALEDGCYEFMFQGCTSLARAPDLPAATLKKNCYYRMFRGCSGISSINVAFTSWPSTSSSATTYNALTEWVYGVAASGMFYCPPALTVDSGHIGVSGCPSGWKALKIGAGLCFFAETSGAQIGIGSLGGMSVSMQYSVNGGQSYSTYTAGTNITLSNVGDSVYFRAASGKNSRMAESSSKYMYFYMGSGAKCSCYGNVMTLLDKDWSSSSEQASGYSMSDYCFCKLFYNCKGLVKAPELPAKKLGSHCYEYAFYGCSNLSSPPVLPATDLKSECYAHMFEASGISVAPVLPATNLTGAVGCYRSMFSMCPNLVDPPDLPATTLEIYCYCYMFCGEYSSPSSAGITHAPLIPAQTLPYDCCYGMYQHCKNLVDAGAILATTFGESCCHNMFYGCDSLESAPDMSHAASMGSECCASMFNLCISLESAPELPATNLSQACYSNMFTGCESLVNAPDLPATDLSGASHCYSNMFTGCESLEVAPKISATQLSSNCFYGMFSNCTSLVSAPDLIATSLMPYCYSYMFYNCSSLTSIRAWFVQWSGNCTNGWLGSDPGVTMSSGVFKHLPSLQIPSNRGADWILSSWTAEYIIPELCFMASQANVVIGMAKSGTPPSVSLEMSMDDGETWEEFDPDEDTVTLANSGDRVYFRSANSYSSALSGLSGYRKFTISGKCGAFGNAMYLVASTPPTSVSSYGMTHLFDGCSDLTSAPSLPATTLNTECYAYMFNGCTSLTAAPELPATYMQTRCYAYMFSGCTGLLSAPTLGSTWLSTECYMHMFDGCTSLTQPPSLPATSMMDRCYAYMFNGCTGITEDVPLNATTTYRGSYMYMFAGCTSLTTVHDLSARSLGVNCFSGMFSGCTSLVTPPSFSSSMQDLQDECFTHMFEGCTSLASAPSFANVRSLGMNCCAYMFKGCTSLLTPPSLGVNYLVKGCYSHMFEDCTSLSYAPDLPAEEVKGSDYTYPDTPYDGCYAYMFKGCTNLTSLPTISAGKLGKDCCEHMFEGCTSLTSADALGASTMAENCYAYMFKGCTSLTTAFLPALTLANGCYSHMFDGCSQLSNVGVGFTSWNASACASWLTGVASSGTFRCMKVLSDKYGTAEWSTGDSGCPSGWTVSAYSARYLCIGMRYSLTNGECWGCDNDANYMDALFSGLGYSGTKLLSSDATKANVLGQLDDEIALSTNNSLFIFYYTGHGLQDGETPSNPDYAGEMSSSGSEPDGADSENEYMCLYDHLLKDDELWAKVEQFNGRVMLIFDACHSQTLYRGVDVSVADNNNKGSNGSKDSKDSKNSRGFFDMVRVSRRSRNSKSSENTKRSSSLLGMLCWGASREDELSWINQHGTPGDSSDDQGYFTEAMLDCWNGYTTYSTTVPPERSYGRLWTTTSTLCNNRKYNQHPQETRDGSGFEAGRVAFT